MRLEPFWSMHLAAQQGIFADMRSNEITLEPGRITRLSTTSQLCIPQERRGSFSRFFSRTLVGFTALASSGMFGFWTLYMRPAGPEMAETPAPPPAVAAASNPYGVLLDPRFFVESAPPSLLQSFPPVASLEPDRLADEGGSKDSAAPAAAVESAEPIASTEPKDAAPIANVAAGGEPVPLPIPRPTDLAQLPVPTPPTDRRLAQQRRRPVVPAVAPDDGSFFDKLFGFLQPSTSAVGFGAPQPAARGLTRNAVSKSPAGYDRWTAVYDIAARTVHLPNGRRLEAPSGLRDKLDDPRYVHVKMHGATPPNVYELKPREQLFHGVQALRLVPIGNGELYGRNGLLAHTYMLGPNGDSNGCVSIKDYNAFLQAYQNGEIKRLVVVAGLN